MVSSEASDVTIALPPCDKALLVIGLDADAAEAQVVKSGNYRQAYICERELFQIITNDFYNCTNYDFTRLYDSIAEE